MPEDADEDKIDASFEDGMLRVDIPRSKEKRAEAKKIEIH